MQAVAKYEEFADMEATAIEEYPAPVFDTGLIVGKLDAIEYTAERSGEVIPYRHEFRKRARPWLCVTAEGKNLFSMAGNFTFTDRGFVDHR